MDAIEHASSRFPFPILGVDSDNGPEFINAHLTTAPRHRTIGHSPQE